MKKSVKLKRKGIPVVTKGLFEIAKNGHNEIIFVYKTDDAPKGEKLYPDNFVVERVGYGNIIGRDLDFNDLVKYFEFLFCDGKTIYFTSPFDNRYIFTNCYSDGPGTAAPLVNLDTRQDALNLAQKLKEEDVRCDNVLRDSGILPNQNSGIKHDDGKLRWDLLAWAAVEKVVEVYNFGAKKYGENTWQKVENFRARYGAALTRHLVEHMKGKKYDEESELLHLSHLVWNALALIWFELQKEGERDE